MRGVFIICFLISVYAQEDEKTVFNEMGRLYINQIVGCAAKENAKAADCYEGIQKGVDLSISKFMPCKCAGACFLKAIKLMNEQGEISHDAVKKHAINITREIARNEISSAADRCLPAPGKHCDKAGNFIACSIQGSDRLTRFVKSLFDGIQGRKSI